MFGYICLRDRLERFALIVRHGFFIFTRFRRQNGMPLHLLLQVISKDHNVLSVVANSAWIRTANNIWHLAKKFASAKIRELYISKIQKSYSFSISHLMQMPNYCLPGDVGMRATSPDRLVPALKESASFQQYQYTLK